ncbi:MAG: hypothetical protein ACNA7I_06170 [Candidatus Methanoperedens sp.]
MQSKKLLFIIILLIYGIIPGALAAGIHGTVYSWSDFETPLKNVMVEVNSTPAQSKVATDGRYSFDLQPGSYLVTAKYYRNNVLEYFTEEEVIIDIEGEFIIDLILFPPTGMEHEFLGDINLADVGINNDNNLNGYILVLGLFLGAAFALGYLYMNKKNPVHAPGNENDVNIPVSEETTEIEGAGLPADLRELLVLVHGMGGRVTQKELRKKLHYSEAKVSLMITDLESRGLVTKIKKGRANVIISVDKK